MKAYIQCSKINHLPSSDNFYKAYLAFYEMGFDTQFFETPEELLKSKLEDVIVGYVGTVRFRLKQFGITTPEMDYPEELTGFLGRKVWSSTINHINFHPELWPLFVKSVEDKEITGVVVKTPKDLVGCGTCGIDRPVHCSEIVNILAEWRCFIRYGKILDIRPYKGDYYHHHYDFDVIKKAVLAHTTAPAGYAMDFGVTDKGETILIEVNDGYALGSYGLLYYDYAKLLSARWVELTNTEDVCRF